MIQGFTASLRLTRRRACVLALLAVLAPTACNNADPLATTESSDPPTAAATPDSATAADSVGPALATTSYSGRLYGPVNLWATYTTVKWGPAPFTGSVNPSGAGGIVTQINAARLMKQRLTLALTSGPSTDYTTNGKFDLTKWKKRMSSYNTSTIKNAVAAAVSDGTVIGNQLIDEPETVRWGGNVSKAMVDDMAVYARSIFPTLPMGINIGPPAYAKWRPTEHFYKLDWVRYQYSWWVTQGNVTAWRDAVLSRARADGVTPAFSVNILDGGVPDRNGTWDCPGTGGKGTYYPNCRLTADQLRSWGQTLAGSGCFTMMWRFDYTFMSKTANQDAFKALATTTKALSPRSCKRP